MIIVSACLAGIKCRYDGKANSCVEVIKLVENGVAIPLCPEQLGGLSTPRNPAEIVDDKVINKDGVNVTEQFTKGAEETLRIAELVKADRAILKANSPSCGSCHRYDGTFSGNIIPGLGKTAELLKSNGIIVISEKDL